jgi:isopropylmalate/homocitrate/citramalate synthase
MPGVAITSQQKVLIATELSRLGCHIIDVGLPASGDSERRALQLILSARERGAIRPEVEILVICRAVERDIDLTIEAVRAAGYGPEELTFLIFTSASPLHCKYKLGEALRKREGVRPRDADELPLAFYHEANKRMIADAIAYARSRGARRIESGGEDGSRTPIDLLLDLGRTVIAAGAVRYMFADTTGCLTPEATRQICKALVTALPDVELGNHFHNDFGLATANVLTAVLNGVSTFSSTINGLGERAGNASLHTVVTALKYLYGVEIPGFEYDRLCHAKRIVERATGIPVSPLEPVIGDNAFTHESGIHTHGVAVCRQMYEVLPYRDVGAEGRFVYGKHSGTYRLRQVLAAHASVLPEVDDHFVEAVLDEIKQQRALVADDAYLSDAIGKHYAHLRRLSFDEQQVIALARQVADRADRYPGPGAGAKPVIARG